MRSGPGVPRRVRTIFFGQKPENHVFEDHRTTYCAKLLQKNRRFRGPAHLAWTPPKIKKLTKPAKTIEILCSITKTVKNSRKYGISCRFAEFRVKNALIRPIYLFVYYNSSDHWAKKFLYFSFLWSTDEKFVIWVVLKRKIVPRWWALFLEKTTWSDKMTSWAARAARRPKINSWKTQLDSVHLKKNNC